MNFPIHAKSRFCQFGIEISIIRINIRSDSSLVPASLPLFARNFHLAIHPCLPRKSRVGYAAKLTKKLRNPEVDLKIR